MDTTNVPKFRALLGIIVVVRHFAHPLHVGLDNVHLWTISV